MIKKALSVVLTISLVFSALLFTYAYLNLVPIKKGIVTEYKVFRFLGASHDNINDESNVVSWINIDAITGSFFTYYLDEYKDKISSATDDINFMAEVRRYRHYKDENVYHGTFDALIFYDYSLETFYLLEVYYSYDFPTLVRMMTADLELQNLTRPNNPFADDNDILDFVQSTFELFRFIFIDSRFWLRNYVVYIFQDLILY